MPAVADTKLSTWAFKSSFTYLEQVCIVDFDWKQDDAPLKKYIYIIEYITKKFP